MQETIQIPRTIDSAVRSLTDLNGLLTTKEYERSAIVSAFISSGQYTIAAFAKLGIAGLTNKDTVAHYLDAWKQAVNDGVARPVSPGQKVTLPPADYEFPANPTVARNVSDPERRDRLTGQANEDGVGASKVLDVASNPRAVASAVKADPKFLDRVLSDQGARETILVAHQNLLKQESEERLAARGMSLPKSRRQLDPQDEPEPDQELSSLRVAGILNDIFGYSEHAVAGAEHTLADYDRIARLIDGEDRSLVLEHAQAAANAWQLVLSRIQEGATDAALQEILNEGR